MGILKKILDLDIDKAMGTVNNVISALLGKDSGDNGNVKEWNDMDDIERAHLPFKEDEWNRMDNSEHNRLEEMQRLDREEMDKFLEACEKKSENKL